MITCFNTKRIYTEFGQRIAAELLPSGEVLFVDIDRGIDGLIEAPRLVTLEDGQKLQQFTLSNYDNGNYYCYGYDQRTVASLKEYAEKHAPKMPRKYHTLVEKEGDQWCIAFGDYDRRTVEQEMHSQDIGFVGRIITTNDDQASIDAAVSALNS
jgi:hypothetical protein